jgi:hypothetical protein
MDTAHTSSSKSPFPPLSLPPDQAYMKLLLLSVYTTVNGIRIYVIMCVKGLQYLAGRMIDFWVEMMLPSLASQHS